MKRFTAILAALAVLCTTPVFAENDYKAYVIGDVNSDRVLDMKDVLAFRKYLVCSAPTTFDADCADLYFDGAEDFKDLLLMRKLIAGIITDFPSDGANYSFVAMQPLAEFNGANPHVVSYIENVSYVGKSRKISLVSDYLPTDGSRADKPVGYTLTAQTSGYLSVFDYEEGVAYRERVEPGEVAVRDTIPGHTVEWYLSDNDGKPLSGGKVCDVFPRRFFSLSEEVLNFRDRGGIPCASGSIRYGAVIRGSQINGNLNIEERDIKLLRDFCGVADEIDLRTDPKTRGEDGIIGTEDDVPIMSSALGEDVSYVNYPVSVDSVGVGLGTDSAFLYGAALKRIAADVSEGKCVYIHCSAGADRAGTLCALLEAILGVPLEEIDRDYELTSFRNSSEYIRPRTKINYAALISYIRKIEGATFTEKAENWALASGVTAEEIEILRSCLIESRN